MFAKRSKIEIIEIKADTKQINVLQTNLDILKIPSVLISEIIDFLDFNEIIQFISTTKKFVQKPYEQQQQHNHISDGFGNKYYFYLSRLKTLKIKKIFQYNDAVNFIELFEQKQNSLSFIWTYFTMLNKIDLDFTINFDFVIGEKRNHYNSISSGDVDSHIKLALKFTQLISSIICQNSVSLKTIKIHKNFHYDSYHGIYQNISACINLEHLKIKIFPSKIFPSKIFQNILNNCQKLHVIELYDNNKEDHYFQNNNNNEEEADDFNDYDNSTKQIIYDICDQLIRREKDKIKKIENDHNNNDDNIILIKSLNLINFHKLYPFLLCGKYYGEDYYTIESFYINKFVMPYTHYFQNIECLEIQTLTTTKLEDQINHLHNLKILNLQLFPCSGSNNIDVDNTGSWKLPKLEIMKIHCITDHLPILSDSANLLLFEHGNYYFDNNNLDLSKILPNSPLLETLWISNRICHNTNDENKFILSTKVKSKRRIILPFNISNLKILYLSSNITLRTNQITREIIKQCSPNLSVFCLINDRRQSHEFRQRDIVSRLKNLRVFMLLDKSQGSEIESENEDVEDENLLNIFKSEKSIHDFVSYDTHHYQGINYDSKLKEDPISITIDQNQNKISKYNSNSTSKDISLSGEVNSFFVPTEYNFTNLESFKYSNILYGNYVNVWIQMFLSMNDHSRSKLKSLEIGSLNRNYSFGPCLSIPNAIKFMNLYTLKLNCQFFEEQEKNTFFRDLLLASPNLQKLVLDNYTPPEVSQSCLKILLQDHIVTKQLKYTLKELHLLKIEINRENRHEIIDLLKIAQSLNLLYPKTKIYILYEYNQSRFKLIKLISKDQKEYEQNFKNIIWTF
jgi:hypothetical protein